MCCPVHDTKTTNLGLIIDHIFAPDVLVTFALDAAERVLEFALHPEIPRRCLARSRSWLENPIEAYTSAKIASYTAKGDTKIEKGAIEAAICATRSATEISILDRQVMAFKAADWVLHTIEKAERSRKKEADWQLNRLTNLACSCDLLTKTPECVRLRNSTMAA